MKPRRVWLVARAIVASAGAIGAQGFMRRMRERDAILYALTH